MNVLNPALHDTLRTLKLTGMLDTLDARVAQARTGLRTCQDGGINGSAPAHPPVANPIKSLRRQSQ